MKCFFRYFAQAVFVLYVCLTRYSGGSNCTGKNYVIPAYLSCAYVNVASTVNGGRCVNASGSPETCQRALDGSDESLNISNEWYYTGAGVGSWIKIEFAQKYIINTIRVKQRAHIVQQSKGLKLSFMDESNAYVELTKNQGSSNLANAVWDIKSFADVMTNFVKVEVETVYTTASNGFREIEFFHDNCLKDIQSTILDIPRAQGTEIFPLSGKTFSLDIRPVNDVSITLFASPQTDSARYRFLLYDNTEKSTMYRSSKGGNDTIRQFVDTCNPQGQYPQRRTIWIDFRSSNLVLGSGGDVLLQWNDPSPFSVNYVSITSSITESTKITVYNKPHNRKCFKEAEHFWPLDRIHVNTFVHDLIGFKDGTFTNGTIVKGLGYNTFITSASWIRSDKDHVIDLGDFSGSCIGDFTQCQNGITISFWVQFQYVKTGDVLYTSGRHEGVSIAFSEDTSELTITIFSYNETLKISAKMTKTVWYHVFVAARKGTIPWMIINGAEVFWGTVEAFYPAGESNSHFVVGKQQTVGTSLTFRINQLVIWTKALSMTEMKRVFNCAGIQPVYAACASIEDENRVPCAWENITKVDCEQMGCCYNGSVCFKLDERSNSAKLSIGSSPEMSASSYTSSFNDYYGLLTWRDPDSPAERSWRKTAWLPRSTTGDQWLQIDVNQVKTINAVATQGYSQDNIKWYCQTFTLSYSKTGVTWQWYEESNTIKVFTGNSDGTSIVKNAVSAFDARKVRFHVKSWHKKPALKVEIYGNPIPSNYMGCYSGGTFKACGAYDKDMLTPEVCTTCCGVAGYNYSAVKFGDQCLCSNIVDAKRKVDDLQCQISCKGNPVLRCGGYETYSVYEALGEYNFPCSLTMPTNISISEKFIAHFSCQPGASHNLDFGEDMILTTTNATVSYLYQSKGKYMVYGQVFLGDYGEPHSFLTSFSVNVYSSMKLFELNCPRAVEANVTFACLVSIFGGISMHLDAHFTNGSMVSTPLADAQTFHVGEMFRPTSAGGIGIQAMNKTVLIPSYKFKADGKLVGWRICSETSGFVSLQVFRPVCGRGLHSAYCYLNGKCETDLLRCPNASSSLCTDSEVFSMGLGACANWNISSEILSSISLSDEYELIVESQVFLWTSGCHIFPFDGITTSTDVKEGDILGFSYQGCGFAEITSRKIDNSEQLNVTSFFFENTALGLGSILNTKTSPPYTIDQIHYSLVAVHSIPSVIWFPHTYFVFGQYHEEVTVSGPWNTIKKAVPITVTEIVTNVTVTAAKAVATNGTFFFTIHPHPGYNTTYVISYGNGDNTTLFSVGTQQEKHLSYEYGLRGTYTFSLYAGNLLSFSIKTCNVTVQDAVKGLTFRDSILPAALGNVTIVQWFVRQGNGFYTIVDFGDGNSIKNGSFDNADLFAVINSHRYATVGEYIVTINVSNFISNASIQDLAVVEIPLSGVTCQVIHAHRDIEVNETVTLQVTATQGTNVEMSIDFGDGSTTTSRELSVQHAYSTYNVYNISFSVYNNVSRFNVSKEIQVHKPVNPLIGFNVTCLHTNLTKPTPCMLNISIGTDFTCTWNWDDGLVEETSFGLLGNFTYHNYTTVGHYTISLNCSNRLNKTEAVTTAIVEEPIIGLEVDEKVAHPFASDFEVTFRTARGTDPIFNVTFTHLASGSSFNVPVTTANKPLSESALISAAIMPDIGIYELKVTAVNYVTPPQTVYLTIMIDVPIANAILIRSHKFIEVYTTANFSCTMTAGSNVSLLWDFGDGSPVKTQFYQGNFSNEGVTVYHDFQNEGIYIVTLSVNNSVSDFILHIPVYIQNPHYLVLTTNSPQDIPPGIVSFFVSLEPSKEHPTNSSYTVDYGDGTTSPEQPFFGPLNLQHNYSRHGAYIMSINFTNDIQTVSMETEVEVQTPISNLLVFSSHTGPAENKGKPGWGPQKTYFPCDFPVFFNTTIQSGTNVSYYWNFGDERTVVTTNTSVNHSFPNPGQYTVTVQAANVLSQQSQSLSVDIQCMAKIATFTNDGPKILNLPITFKIVIEQVGTASCYLVELGDNMIFNYKMDTSATCPQACSKIDEKTRRFTDPRGFSITHTYSQVGKYALSVTACNLVYSATVPGETACTPKPCSKPQVMMDPETTGNSPENAKAYFPWKQISIKNVIEINCEASDKTDFSWKICKINSHHGTCISYKLPASVSVTRARLDLKSRTLPYGEYCLQFTCAMVGVDGIYNSSYGCIRIVPSELEAVIDGGESRSIGAGKRAVIKSYSTRDPDVDEKENHPNDFKRCWFCAKYGTYDRNVLDNCTELPAFPLVPLPQLTLVNSSSNGTQPNSTVVEKSGCFGYPPGRLTASSAKISFSTEMMELGQKYDVCMLAMKDTRKRVACTTIEIVEGDPPVVEISCVNSVAPNCKTKISPTDKLALRGAAACEACLPMFTEYKWLILKQVARSGAWKKVANVENMLSTHRFGQTLAVKSRKLIGGTTYKFRLECWDKRFGSRGYSEYVKEVNRPPINGSCEIKTKNVKTPHLGYAFQDDFTIKCHGWQDNTKLLYTVSAQVADGEPKIVVPVESVLDVGKDYSTPPFSLPVGRETNKFWIKVYVTIKDEDGATTKWPLKAQVKMPEQSEEEKVAMVNDQVNKIDHMMTAGDSTAVLSVVGNIAAAFLQPSSTKKSGEQREEVQTSQSKQENMVKEKLVDAISKISMPFNPENAVQIASCLSAVTGSGSASMTTQAKAKVAEAITNVASVLDDEMSSEQRDVLAKNLLGPIGEVMDTTSPSVDKSAVNERDSTNSSETKRQALKVKDKLLDSICKSKLVNEEPHVITTEKLSLSAAVNLPSDLTGMSILDRGAISGLEAAVDTNSTEPIQSQMAAFKSNPYGGAVNGGVIEFKLKDSTGNTKNVSSLTRNMDIFIPADGSTAESYPHTIKKGDLLVTNLNVTDNRSAIYVWVAPETNNTRIVVLLRKDAKPTLKEYDFKQEIQSMFFESDHRRFVMFIDNDDLNRTAAGKWYCGFYYNGSAQDALDTVSFNTTIIQLTCKYLNTTSNNWQYDGCKPGPNSTLKRRHCSCNHLTSFSSDFFVPPNKIDWDKISLEELLKNPLVFSVVCGIFGLYFLLLLWARRADRKDLEKVGVAPLPDNDPRDTYMYEIVVYTGFASHSGTSSKVRIVLVGGLDETSPRRLKDTEPGRRKFCQGNVDYFLLSVPQSLGKLNSLRIWHDNTGDDPSWYLLRIMVHDLQTDQKTWFICDRWLAVEEEDGMVERTLTPASKEELTSFNLLFSTEARKNLTDNHLWFSVVARPAKSSFTRVQRLSCCLSVLLSTMLANAMFYEVGDESSTGTSVHVGPFTFSMKQLSIGITSSLVVLPANVLIVMFFRKARPSDRKVVLDKAQDPHGQSTKYEVSGDDKPLEKSKEEDKVENEEKKKRDKKKKTLPHYFVYISYALVFITCSVSATFTIFYGLTFGKEKSEGWLSSMMISFWQDVLVSQPLKVFAAAMFFAVVIKDPNKAEDENDQDNKELSPDEEILHNQKQNSDEEKTLRKIGFVDKPPNPEELEAARLLKTKQKQMKAIIREVIQYLVFLSLLLVVAYGSRDPMAFPITNAMHGFFDEGDYSGNGGIEEVSDYRSYWNWVQTTFIPTLMPRYWYGPFAIDDEALMKEETTTEELKREKHKTVKKTKTSVSNIEAGFEVLHNYDDVFVADHGTAILVGTARLRQLRVIKGKCKLMPFFISAFEECNVPYTWENEEVEAFEPHWILGSNQSSKDLEPTPWTYQTQWTLKGTPYWGYFATYWGGGYIADFGDDRPKALELSKQLESHKWIDRYTRAIFAEFTVYNAQANFFTAITLLTEILTTGGYYHQPKIQTLKLYRYLGPEMVFVMACEIIYIVFLLYFLYKQIKNYTRERNEYFRDPWHYPELLVLGFSLSAVGLYFTRHAITAYSVSNMLETPEKFVSFQYVAFIDEWVAATTAVAVFFAFLKFLRLLKFNRRVSTLIQTIKIASKPLMSFMLMFCIWFLAYCQFAFLVFGVDNDDYSSFLTTMGSLLSMTLGSFQFHALTDSSRILGPIFFFTYVVSVCFVLMNVFIGILNDVLNEVANDAAIQSNEHEILDFMFHTFKKTVGKQVGPAIKPSYKEPKNKFDLDMDSIEEMTENIQCALRNICMDHIRHSTWFELENATIKKKILMMLVFETDYDFTENDICDSIPLFDEEMKKHSEKQLIRKLVCYRKNKRMEEEFSDEGDEESDKSTEVENEDSENDCELDDDDVSVVGDERGKKPVSITVIVDPANDEESMLNVKDCNSPPSRSGLHLVNLTSSSYA